MTDETHDTHDAEQADQADQAPAAADVTPPAAPLTSEQRLRALAGDRKRKIRPGSRPASGEAVRRPGDIVDAVRERSNRDLGRDTPF